MKRYLIRVHDLKIVTAYHYRLDRRVSLSSALSVARCSLLRALSRANRRSRASMRSEAGCCWSSAANLILLGLAITCKHMKMT